MSVAEVLEELQSSPEFLDRLAHLHQVAEDERGRRERFTEEIDESAEAEFINGQIVVHSPVRLSHLRASSLLRNLLWNFVTQRGLGEVYSEKCFIRCSRNDYEPDICFFRQSKCADWEPSKKIFPPPDLVVEIPSPSTERNDRTVKLQDRARHAVGEYWIVDADARSVEQYILPPGANEYRSNTRSGGDECLASTVLAGFVVPVSAFFDARENQRALRNLSNPL